MINDKLAKVLGVILLICGGIVLIEPINSGKIEDLFAPVFFIGFGLVLIFKGRLGKSKK